MDLSRTKIAARSLLVAAAFATAGGGMVALWVAKVERIRPLANGFVLLSSLLAVVAPVAIVAAERRLRHSAPAAGPTVRAAWLGGVGLWLGTLFLLPNVEGSRIGVAIAAWGGWVALVVWMGRAAPRPVSPGSMAVLTRVLLSASIAVVGCEGVLRLAAWIAPCPLLAVDDAGEDARLAAYALSPGQYRFGFPCNSLGFYDEPFLPRAERERPAVAVIGDSFSASFVPLPYHYTTVAEDDLSGVDFWNVGWSAMSPHEYRRVLERDLLPLDPDAVVVSLFLGNDLLEVRPAGGVDRWLRWLFHRENFLLYQVPARLLQLSRGDVGSNAAPPGQGRSLEEVLQQMPWLLDPLREPGTFSKSAFLDLEVRRAATYSGLDPARLDTVFAELDRMRALVGERPFAVALIPDQAMLDDELWGQVQEHHGTVLDRDGFRHAMIAFCERQGIPCLDFLPALAAVEPLDDGNRHLYLLRDTHWNARGNRVAGEALAPFVGRLLGR